MRIGAGLKIKNCDVCNNTGLIEVKKQGYCECIKGKSKKIEFERLPDNTKFCFKDYHDFYHYEISHNEKRLVEFVCEPELFPVYLQCLKDMMSRHKKNPETSMINREQTDKEMKLTPVDRAIRNISRSIEDAGKES